MPNVSLPDEVRTPRLVLRVWRDQDIESFDRVVRDNLDHLRPWMPWIAAEPLGPSGRQRVLDLFRRERDELGDVAYGVFLDGEPIGSTGLRTRRGPGSLEIGYWIDHRHLRRGYATELSAVLTDLALAQPGIDRVEIHHDRANEISRRVPERLGYRFVGEQVDGPDDPHAPAMEGVDCTWSIDAETWRAVRPGWLTEPR